MSITFQGGILMKRLFVLMLVVLALPLTAIEITIAGAASSFGFDRTGELDTALPAPGFTLGMTERITPLISAELLLDQDPVTGRSLGARLSYETPFISISAGPFFGLMNEDNDKDMVPVLLRSGLSLGFSLTVPGLLVADAGADFCLPATVTAGEVVDIYRSSLSLGFYLPNLLCSLGISQKGTTVSTGSSSSIRSQTDYGFYTEAFKKQSPWKINVDFIWRVTDYFIAEDDPANKKLAHLVLGVGTSWSPGTGLAFFGSVNSSLYSFSLGDPVPGLDEYLFDARLGMRYDIQAWNETRLRRQEERELEAAQKKRQGTEE